MSSIIDNMKSMVLTIELNRFNPKRTDPLFTVYCIVYSYIIYLPHALQFQPHLHEFWKMGAWECTCEHGNTKLGMCKKNCSYERRNMETKGKIEVRMAR